MPTYDYRCHQCETVFEAKHGFHDSPPPCPHCGSANIAKHITTAPAIAGGIATPAGTSRTSSKEELQSKWAEETPRLRQKLEQKLGKETVQKNAPSLYTDFK